MTLQPPGSARFTVRGVLGKGGMGVVYEAYDQETDAVVALKISRSGARGRP